MGWWLISVNGLDSFGADRVGRLDMVSLRWKEEQICPAASAWRWVTSGVGSEEAAMGGSGGDSLEGIDAG